MSRFVITLEDLPNGKVKVEATPSAEEMFKSNLSGHDMTAAQGYALTALNAIQKAAKDPRSQLNIFIPKKRS